jgi:hypothetical protein
VQTTLAAEDNRAGRHRTLHVARDTEQAQRFRAAGSAISGKIRIIGVTYADVPIMQHGSARGK